MMNTPRRLLLLALLATASLCGCSARKTIRVSQRRPDQLTLLVSVAPDANRSAPVNADVVTITDQQVLNQLLATSSQDWFQRSNYAAQHAAQLRVQSFQWTPGSNPPPITIDDTRNAAGILLFVNYATPGAHRTVLPLAAIVRLQCNANNFEVQILP